MIQLLLQLPNVLGLFSNLVLGRRRRIGWVIGLVAEGAWTVWAAVSHNPGLYPWCALWSVVFAWNWWQWRKP